MAIAYDNIDATLGYLLHRGRGNKPWEYMKRSSQMNWIKKGQKFRENLAASGYLIIKR